MAKQSLSQQPQGSSESNRTTMSLSRLCPFPPGGAAGVPRSCLTTSSLSELSEGAGGRHRHVHVLLPFSGSLAPQLVPRLRAMGSERGPPQSAFPPDLGAERAASGNSRQECLQTGLWKQPGKSSTGRGLVLLRGPTGQTLNPARPLPLGSLAQIFLASSGTAP